MTINEAKVVFEKQHVLTVEYDEAYDILFGHYMGEMPYGTAKATTGDPYVWIAEKLVHEAA